MILSSEANTDYMYDNFWCEILYDLCGCMIDVKTCMNNVKLYEQCEIMYELCEVTYDWCDCMISVKSSMINLKSCLILNDYFRFRIDFHTKMVHWDCSWDVDEDTQLLKGIYDYGMGNWEQIKMDHDLGLYDKVGLLMDSII